MLKMSVSIYLRNKKVCFHGESSSSHVSADSRVNKKKQQKKRKKLERKFIHAQTYCQYIFEGNDLSPHYKTSVCYFCSI